MGTARRSLAGRVAAGATACLAILVLAACAAAPPPPPPPPEPTVVQLNLVGSPGLNPDPGGRPSPVSVRVYQLRSPASFQQADIFQLLERESEVLGADLAGRSEVTVRPGASESLELRPGPDVRYIGVVALYRDVDNAIWRAGAPVSANQTNVLRAQLQPLAVSVGRAGS
jgi:type VI secretion system protein VasD